MKKKIGGDERNKLFGSFQYQQRLKKNTAVKVGV